MGTLHTTICKASGKVPATIHQGEDVRTKLRRSGCPVYPHQSNQPRQLAMQQAHAASMAAINKHCALIMQREGADNAN